MLKEGKSITNYEPQSLIAKTVDYSPPLSSHHQYSFYVIDATGVQRILIRLEHQQITHVPNAIVIIMNCLSFPSCLMNHSLLIIMINME
jgi:hypothetical protein